MTAFASASFVCNKKRAALRRSPFSMFIDYKRKSTHHLKEAILAGVILDVYEFIGYFGDHVESALIAYEWVTMFVDPIEYREAETEQRNFCVPCCKLTMGVTDHGVNRFRHEEKGSLTNT